MNKFRKYLIILPILVIGLLSFSNQAKAETITTYPDTATQTADFGRVGAYSIGQVIYPSVPLTINTFKVKLKKIGTPTDNIQARIYSCLNICDDDNTTIQGTLLDTSDNISGSSLTTTSTDYTFTFSSPVEISANTPYLISLWRTGAGDNDNNYQSEQYASPSTAYTPSGCTNDSENDCRYRERGEVSSLWGSANTDFLFEINGTAGAYINITSPTNATTYTTTEIQEEGLTVSGTCGVTNVTVNIQSQSKGWTIDQKTTPCSSNTFSVLLDTNGVWNDLYNINAFNFIGPGSVNDQIEIEVDITSNPRIIPESALPDIEDTNQSFYVDCSSYDSSNFFTAITGGGFFCYLKKTLYAFGAFLIEPAESAKSQFETSINNIKNDFPFSVFFGITEIIQNEIETAPTGATLSIHFPEPLDHTFTILSPTLMEDVVGEDFKDQIFDTITILTWAIVGFMILATVF